eukprot:TRINITY_DN7617_c0_g1_i6.p1 TRINITY_DN7617_c0_g1~~TRINITY_DN7617_c0_g1_i6.p1  ORF type:complete len:262 (-),score=15.66 TRINITY_DN7617_c0_g1_i6:177-962(-)
MLYLMISCLLCSPQGGNIYAHDLRLGVALNGKATASRGHTIHFIAPRLSSWTDALDSILNRLDSPQNSCQQILYIPLAGACLRDELQKALSCGTFYGKPLAAMSGPQRGKVIQDIVLHVDMLINASSCFRPAVRGICVDGRPRPQHCAPYDWMRDGRRIECKSAKLLHVSRSQHWSFIFQNVKLCSFDELLLALYTPVGIYIYRHDLKLGLSTTGVVLQSAGHNIVISSRSNTLDWKTALHYILAKLDSSGCERLALVELS